MEKELPSKPKGKILVVGGNGFYGRYLVTDLIRSTNAEIVIASRNPLNAEWNGLSRIQLVKCDMSDLDTLEQLAEDVNAIIHCAGPFQRLPIDPLHVAIHAKINYVDISEDRAYYREVRKFEESIRHAGITVLSGMSVAPAMELLFANLLRDGFDHLTSVRTFAAPDTRKHRGEAMFHTMFTGVGRSFLQPKDGKLRKVWGWTEPEWIEFPPPLGKRLTYLVLEMADLDLVPELLGVRTVEFKAGTEGTFLNRLLEIAAGIRKLTGYPNWEKLTNVVRAFSWIIGRLGKDEEGVVFEIGGILRGNLITHHIAVIARHDGGLIPSVLASIATRRILSGELTQKGVVPFHRWIASDDLISELGAKGLEIWWKPYRETKWLPFDLIHFQDLVQSNKLL